MSTDHQQNNRLSRQRKRDVYFSQLAQRESSEQWVQWEYSPEEWMLFDRIDWRSRHRTFWLITAGALVFLLATGLSWTTASQASDRIPVAFWPAFLLWMVFFAAFCLSLYPYAQARERHKARQKQDQPRRVTLAKLGVWEAGTYFPLAESGIDLKKVTLTSQPLVLHFRRRGTVQDSVSLEDGSLPQFDTLRVLIPSGYEEEAANLLERFRTEVIEARKQARQLQSQRKSVR